MGPKPSVSSNLPPHLFVFLSNNLRGIYCPGPRNQPVLDPQSLLERGSCLFSIRSSPLRLP